MTILPYIIIIYALKLFIILPPCFIKLSNVPQIPSTNPQTPNVNPQPISVELNQQIERHLERWVASYGYLQCQVSINDLAIVVGTNRTYLSRYINTKYGCSFKVWINKLRIERAQVILLESDRSIVQIASEVGYPSSSSFIHTFKRYTGVSTSQWRNENVALQKC